MAPVPVSLSSHLRFAKIPPYTAVDVDCFAALRRHPLTCKAEDRVDLLPPVIFYNCALGLIFFRKDDRGFEARINQAVFPALQGGPHEHQIAGTRQIRKGVRRRPFSVAPAEPGY